MKKLLIKYLIMYLPFVLGLVLFSSGVVNIFSSLLLFFGGYIAIKNTFDYRLVRRNINKIETYKAENNIGDEDNDIKDGVIIKNKEKVFIKPKKSEDIIGTERTRRYTKVRRKY